MSDKKHKPPTCPGCGYDPTDMSDPEARRGLCGAVGPDGLWYCAHCYSARYLGTTVQAIQAAIETDFRISVANPDMGSRG